MPAATDVEVHIRWIDEELRLRLDLRANLDAAISAVSGGPEPPEVAVRTFAETLSASFSGLGTLIAGAYYMDDRVREALGYPPWSTRPAQADRRHLSQRPLLAVTMLRRP